ncbi:MAG: CPXCG motif-containing cysteine-rich protein [Pseudomonadota bacterium]
MLQFIDIHCPSCGEPGQLAVDPSGGDQVYIEDCAVCCRPMRVRVSVDATGAAQATVEPEA